MYPQQELNRLAAHKVSLQRKIGLHRTACVEAAGSLARPFAWADRALAFWRRVSPIAMLAAVPVGFLLRRTVAPRLNILGSLLRWGPMVLGAVRGAGSVLRGRAGSGK